MPTLTQRLFGDLTTAGTGLRGVLGVHADDRTTGSFSLVVEHRLEQPQPRIVCRQGQVSILSKKTQRQIFNGNQRVGLGQLRCDLVPKVFSLVGYPFVQAGHALGLLVPIRRAFGLCEQATVGRV